MAVLQNAAGTAGSMVGITSVRGADAAVCIAAPCNNLQEHLDAKGYNAMAVYECNNCWVRNVSCLRGQPTEWPARQVWHGAAFVPSGMHPVAGHQAVG